VVRMKVLVTGSRGFIGKNLIMKLKEEKDLEILEYDKDMDQNQLERYCKEVDFVYHLAGINRTDDEEEFIQGNAGFTLDLLELLSKYNKGCPLMLASSIQATYENSYGKSKKAAEELVLSYSIINQAKVFIYRLPNVFGKWCKPNYNSVVATFCYNIPRNLPITIHDPEKVITLVYIDDLVNELIGLLQLEESHLINSNNFYEILPTYSISLKKIAQLLSSFQKARSNGYIPDLADEFTKKLYSTYLSYLPEGALSYKLTMHCDDRGSFTEFLKSDHSGQISINVIKPGIIKGNHYHHTKVEKFLVISGRGVIRLKHVISGQILEFYVSSEALEVIEIPVGYTHNIENLGKQDMIVLIWCNEIFDKNKLDTYMFPIESTNDILS